MCRYLAGEVIVIRYQHIAGCQSLYSYILIGREENYYRMDAAPAFVAHPR